MASFTSNGIFYTDDQFHQQGRPQFRRRHGLTEAVVTFRGPAPRSALFAQNLDARKFPAMNFFGAPIQTSNFTGYDVDDDPIFPRFSLYFDVGSILRNPLPVTAKALQAVSIPITYSIPVIPIALNYTLNIQFHAIQTTWIWFETKKPGDDPRYNTVDSKENPWDNENIVSLSAQYGSSETDPAGLLELVRLGGRDSPVIRVLDYVREEMIPGKFWMCTSVIARTIDPEQSRFTYIAE